MAEVVQLRLEESLPVLQELQKAGIFNNKEIRLIIKKRKLFEYRLQRYVKSKEDYLNYIQYEINLLKLLQFREKRLTIQVDYDKVHFVLVSRINGVFRKAVSRFQSDVKLWLSWIQFARQVNWKHMVSRLYASMLQVHSNKPEIWIAAAKFEMEEMNAPEVARNLLLRGLRFHRRSTFVYLEYFKMELIHAKKKRDELGILFFEDVEKKYADDPVVCGKIALAVYKNAIDVIQDVSLAISFLKISQDFYFTYNIQKVIYEDLQKKFPKCEESLFLIAKQPFQEFICSDKGEGKLPNVVEMECRHRLEEAVVTLPTEKMFSLYLDFCQELLDSSNTNNQRIITRARMIAVMAAAAKQKLLSSKYYALWARYDKNDHGYIMELATKQFPKDVNFWLKRVLHRMENTSRLDSTLALIDEALKSVPSSDSYKLWNVLISLHMANWPKDVTDIFERGIAAHSSVASRVKIQYLEWVLLKDGIKAARKLFKRLWSMPPITLDFFDKACEMELAQAKPSVKHLCNVMDAACSKFGTTNVDYWIRYLQLIKRYSNDVGQTGTIYWRAVKTLDSNVVDKFITHCTLLCLHEK